MLERRLLTEAAQQELKVDDADEVVAVIAFTRHGKEVFFAADDLAVRTDFPLDEIKYQVAVHLRTVFVDVNGTRQCCYKNYYWPC